MSTLGKQRGSRRIRISAERCKDSYAAKEDLEHAELLFAVLVARSFRGSDPSADTATPPDLLFGSSPDTIESDAEVPSGPKA
ncbi:hypothetical protein JW921_09680 [Candidatus Fermentibacterales bacterium]|nr:hypothetical protein [Candidatus Fermentibacterales bacterium]